MTLNSMRMSTRSFTFLYINTRTCFRLLFKRCYHPRSFIIEVTLLVLLLYIVLRHIFYKVLNLCSSFRCGKVANESNDFLKSSINRFICSLALKDLSMFCIVIKSWLSQEWTLRKPCTVWLNVSPKRFIFAFHECRNVYLVDMLPVSLWFSFLGGSLTSFIFQSSEILSI